jgi:hypothetical protein
MATSWQEQLSKVFPGSTTPLEFESIRKVQEKVIDDWDSKPFIFTVGGVEQEFFSIGHLGKALGNRSPITLRKWETDGILPKSPYVKPSSTPNGRRRMYTRDMVEGLVEIAKTEGVLWPQKGNRLSETKFQQRAHSLFQSLRSQQKR